MILEDEHFEIFKAECEKWIDFFGLKDYETSIRFIKSSDEDCLNDRNKNIVNEAYCSADIYMGLTLIELEKNWKHIENPDNLKSYYIKKVAFHEVCELLLWELWWMGTCRYIQPEELDVARHRVIRRLENSVFKNIMEDKIKVSNNIDPGISVYTTK